MIYVYVDLGLSKSGTRKWLVLLKCVRGGCYSVSFLLESTWWGDRWRCQVCCVRYVIMKMKQYNMSYLNV